MECVHMLRDQFTPHLQWIFVSCSFIVSFFVNVYMWVFPFPFEFFIWMASESCKAIMTESETRWNKGEKEKSRKPRVRVTSFFQLENFDCRLSPLPLRSSSLFPSFSLVLLFSRLIRLGEKFCLLFHSQRTVIICRCDNFLPLSVSFSAYILLLYYNHYVLFRPWLNTCHSFLLFFLSFSSPLLFFSLAPFSFLENYLSYWILEYNINVGACTCFHSHFHIRRKRTVKR